MAKAPLGMRDISTTGGSRHSAWIGRRLHSTITSGTGVIGVGDIVQRVDQDGKNRYVVVNIRAPWVYTRRISGSGGPGVITFPSVHMLRKVG